MESVRDAAVRAAESGWMETMPIRMSAEGFEAFMAAVSGSAVAVPEMVERLRRAAPWETGAGSLTANEGAFQAGQGIHHRHGGS